MAAMCDQRWTSGGEQNIVRFSFTVYSLHYHWKHIIGTYLVDHIYIYIYIYILDRHRGWGTVPQQVITLCIHTFTPTSCPPDFQCVRLPRSINSMWLDSSVGKSAGTEKRKKTIWVQHKALSPSCYIWKRKKVSRSQIKDLVDVSSSTLTAWIYSTVWKHAGEKSYQNYVNTSICPGYPQRFF